MLQDKNWLDILLKLLPDHSHVVLPNLRIERAINNIELSNSIAKMGHITQTADDMKTADGHYEITTIVEKFEDVRKSLEDAGISMETSEVTRIPANTVAVDENKGKALIKLMDILEDHDDIQKSYSNFDIPDDVMNAILEGN